MYEHRYAPVAQSARQLIVERHTVLLEEPRPDDRRGDVVREVHERHGRVAHDIEDPSLALDQQIHRPPHPVRTVHHVLTEVIQPGPLDPELLVGGPLHRDHRQAVLPQLPLVPEEVLDVLQDDPILEIGPERLIVLRHLYEVLFGGSGVVRRLEETFLEQRSRGRVQRHALTSKAVPLELLRLVSAVRMLRAMDGRPPDKPHSVPSQKVPDLLVRRGEPIVLHKRHTIQLPSLQNRQDTLPHRHRTSHTPPLSEVS